MESDLQPDEGAVKASPITTMTYMAAAAQENAGLAPTPQVSQITGLEPTHNIVDLIDADGDDDEDLSSEVVHELEDVSENENNQP